MLCSKVLSLILQAALGSRAEDVTRAYRYSGPEHLSWKHIQIKLVVAPGGSEQWAAEVTLAYTKSYKDDLSMARTHEFYSDSEPDHLIVCPILWLLVLALRTGAVAQTSYHDLCRDIKRTENKLFIWATPERPVLLAFGVAGCQLDMTKPASSRQIEEILRRGAESIGMLATPVPHDLRRGAVRDIAYLPKPPRGGAIEDAARVLDHLPGTRDAGVTDEYIGHWVRTRGVVGWTSR